MTEPIQMCSLHPVSWKEKRCLGSHSVLPKYGGFGAADVDLILLVEFTWPLIPKEEFGNSSFRPLLDVVIGQGKG